MKPFQRRQRPQSANPRLFARQQHDNDSIIRPVTRARKPRRPASAKHRRPNLVRSTFYRNMYGTTDAGDIEYYSRKSMHDRIQTSINKIRNRRDKNSASNTLLPAKTYHGVGSKVKKMLESMSQRESFFNAMKQGTLRITVLRCSDLQGADEISNKSDPYITMAFVNMGRHSGDKYATNVKFKTINPVYNDEFKFRVYNMNNKSKIQFTIWDEDGENDEKIGFVALPLGPFTKFEYINNNGIFGSKEELGLKLKPQGMLYIKYDYIPDRRPLATNAKEKLRLSKHIAKNSILHELDINAHEMIGKILSHATKLDEKSLLPMFEAIFAGLDASKKSLSSEDVAGLLLTLSSDTERAQIELMAQNLDIRANNEITLKTVLEYFVRQTRKQSERAEYDFFTIAKTGGVKLHDSIFADAQIVLPLSSKSFVADGFVVASMDEMLRVYDGKMQYKYKIYLNEKSLQYKLPHGKQKKATKVRATDLTEISKDGCFTKIAAACNDHCVRIFDIPTIAATSSALNIRARVRIYIRAVVPLCITSKGLHIFVGDNEGVCTVVKIIPNGNTSDWSIVGKSDLHAPAWIKHLRWAPFLNGLVSAALDGQLLLSKWDFDPYGKAINQHKVTLYTHSCGIKSFDYSMKSHTIIVSCFDNSICIIDPLVCAVIGRLGTSGFHGHRSEIVSVHCNDLYDQYISCSKDGNIKVWDSRTFTIINSQYDKTQEDGLKAAECDKESGRFYTGGSTISVWMPVANVSQDKKHNPDKLIAIKGPLVKLHVNFLLYCLPESGVVTIYESSFAAGEALATSKILYKVKNSHSIYHEESSVITCVEIHQNGKSFYTAAEDGSICQWNVSSGWKIRKFESTKSLITSMLVTTIRHTFSLIVVGWDGRITFFSESGKLLSSNVVESKDDLSCIVRCGEHMYACSSTKGEITIWVFGTRRVRKRLCIPGVISKTTSVKRNSSSSDPMLMFKPEISIDCMVYLKKYDILLAGTSYGVVIGLHVVESQFIDGGKSSVCSYNCSPVTAMVTNESVDPRGRILQAPTLLMVGDINGGLRLWKPNFNIVKHKNNSIDFGKPIACFKPGFERAPVNSIQYIPKFAVFAVPTRKGKVVLINGVGEKIQEIKSSQPLDFPRGNNNTYTKRKGQPPSDEGRKQINLNFADLRSKIHKTTLDTLRTKDGVLLMDLRRQKI